MSVDVDRVRVNDSDVQLDHRDRAGDRKLAVHNGHQLLLEKRVSFFDSLKRV